MKRLLNLMQQDLLLSLRHHTVIFTGVTLVLMVALAWWMPESVGTEVDEVVYDASEDGQFGSFLRAAGAGEGAFVESEQALRETLADSNRGIGIVIEGSAQQPSFRLLTVGRLADENINLMQATLDSMVRLMRGAQPQGFEVQFLRAPSDPVPLNLSTVPIGLVFEVVLLGFFFGAVMIFQEKQQGVNRAYRVSPATTVDYIVSKTTLFAVMSLIYGALLLLAVFGLDAAFGPVLLLVALTSMMMTMFGLAIAAFFNSISDWFFVGLGVLVLNLLPVLSYAIPAFAPQWLTWIPSYPVLFGVRELLFPTGASGFLMPLVLQLLAFNVIAFGAAYLALERKLMKAS